MRANFSLLVDHKIHNWMRKLAIHINAKYQTGLLASSLPPHISLKGSFPVTDLDAVETYFDSLANSIQPLEIVFTQLQVLTTSMNNKRYGIVWLQVQENAALRTLHDRINRELSERFENTDAEFDGANYKFHATIAMGEYSEVYQKIYDECHGTAFNMNYKARELAMFYSDHNDSRPGSFITYKVLPIGTS